jgi:hypothetical protein
MSSILKERPASEIAGAHVMARAWLAFCHALWRGSPAASAFAEWLAGFWEPALERPAGRPDATSPHLTGHPIAWFERDGWVSGHLPGQRGGYLLPREIVFDYPWRSLAAPAA